MGRLEGQGDGATGRQEEPKPKTQNPELKTNNQKPLVSGERSDNEKDQRPKGTGRRGEWEKGR
jgi:hypothetical protein